MATDDVRSYVAEVRAKFREGARGAEINNLTETIQGVVGGAKGMGFRAPLLAMCDAVFLALAKSIDDADGAKNPQDAALFEQDASDLLGLYQACCAAFNVADSMERDMGIAGPRPEVPAYDDSEDDEPE
jgi:hypothetical protein